MIIRLHIVASLALFFTVSCKDTKEHNATRELAAERPTATVSPDMFGPPNGKKTDSPRGGSCCSIQIDMKKEFIAKREDVEKAYSFQEKNPICFCRYKFHDARRGTLIRFQMENGSPQIDSDRFDKFDIKERRITEECILKEIEPKESVNQYIRRIDVLFRGNSICYGADNVTVDTFGE